MCSCKGTKNSLCQCHCGTRVDINPQLLQQKQLWKSKYQHLELQHKENLKNLRQKIYKECSTMMEQEFKAKQQAFKEVERRRLGQYQILYDKWVMVEPKIGELGRENQFLKGQVRGLREELEEAEGRVEREKRHHAADLKQIVQRHEAQLDQLEQQKEQEFDRERKQLESQIYHLRHQISDFEAKYRQILPELQRLKHTLHSKTSEVEDLRSKLGDESRIRQDPFAETTNRRIRGPNQTTLEFQYRTLQRELQEKNKQIDKLKNAKDQVKTEIKTVYIEKPVEVQVIKEVQRIVEVERIVKEYIEPKQPVVVNEIICDDGKEDYDELVVEINNRTRYISQLQNQLAMRIRENEQYQGAAEEYQRNIEKYKSQRLNLAQTIANKNREIEALESRMQMVAMQSQSVGNGGTDKIVVNVRKDGTYSSNVERGKVTVPSATRKK